MCQSAAPGQCITCAFIREQYQLAIDELALTRATLRALCGDRADELIHLMQSRVQARREGAPELVIDVERRFAATLASTVPESAASLVAQLGELTTS